MFNFSNFNIFNELIQLLNQGLNFVPTPQINNSLEHMIQDMEYFFKRLTIHYYIQNNTHLKPIDVEALTKVLLLTNTSLKGLTQLKLL